MFKQLQSKFKYRIMWLFTVILLLLLIPQWTAAQTNNALSFDGDGDYVSIPDNDALDVTTSYTIEAWIRPQQNTYCGIYWKGASGSYLMLNPGSKLSIAFDGYGSNEIVTLGAWQHIAAVNDNGTRHLYLNGIEQPFAEGEARGVTANSDPFLIGSCFGAGLFVYKGDIDEFRIWNKARTSSEIISTMVTELTGSESNLVAYYNFNQGVAGGTNTSITALNSSVTPNLPGDLIGFALSGSTSNFVGGYAATLDVSSASINIERTAGSTISFSIASNTSWSITGPSGSWYTLDVTSGFGADTITVTATQSNETLATRSIDLVVSGTGAESKTITVTQQKWSAIASENSVTLNAAAGSTTSFSISANTDWTITESCDWFSVAPSTGSGNQTITITADLTNQNSGRRTDTLIISGTNASNDTLIVSQLSASIFFSETQVDIDVMQNSRAKFSLATDVDWNATCSESWLTVSSLSGTGNDTLTVTAQVLPEGVTSRSVNIIFTGLFKTDTVVVTQAALPNNALSFDGSDDYVDLANFTTSYDFSQGFSFAGWVKWDAFTGNARLFELTNGSDSHSDEILLRIHGGTGKLALQSANGTTNTEIISDSAVVTTGSWCYVATTISSSGAANIYVNGALVKRGSVNVPQNVERVNNWLGKSAWSGDAYFSGSLDEVSFWNKELTQPEIVALLRNGITGSESNMVAFYNFSQGVANGDNQEINYLYSKAASPQIDGTLANFALTGTSSNWVSGYEASSVSSNLELSDSLLTLESLSGNSTEFVITSNVAWDISSSESWYELDTYSGFGNDTITITSKAVNLLASDELTISSTGISKSLLLNLTYPSFNFSADTLWICDTDRKGSFVVTTSVDSWSATSRDSWLTTDIASGSGNDTITITTEALPAGVASRLTKIDISSSYISDSVVVLQYAPQNNALSFDGTNDYVDFADFTTDYDFSQGFSFTGWVKWDAITYDARVFELTNGSNSYLDNIILRTNSEAGYLTLQSVMGVIPTNMTTDSIVFTTGTWNHVAVTIGSSGAAKIYVNGILVKSGTVNVPRNVNRVNNWLGKSVFSSDSYFNGDLDEVSFWHKELAQSEIVGSLLNGFGGTETGLVSYYKFNQGWPCGDNTSITALTDGSSNGLNGVLTNMNRTKGNTTSNFVAGYTLSNVNFGLAVSDSLVSVNGDANSTNGFSVKSNGSWSLMSSESWLSFNKTSGLGNDSIIVTAEANPLTDTRSAKVVLMLNGTSTDTVTVIQQKATITASPDTYLVSGKSAVITSQVTTTLHWKATASKSWLSVSGDSVSGSAALDITLTNNVGGTARTGYIYLSHGSIADTIIVRQETFDGSGIAGDPYLISNYEELKAVGELPTTVFQLTNNIDASPSSSENSGAGFEPIGSTDTPFTGTFDGKGFYIKNLTINRSTSNAGLFGVVNSSSATVINLGLVNCSVSGGEKTGGLIGYLANGTVSGCYTTGSVSNAAYFCGGLVGYTSGTVTGCYSACSVSSSGFAGGLAGASSGTIQHCYATGMVDAPGAGGLIGRSSGQTKNSFAAGILPEDDTHCGGITSLNVLDAVTGNVTYCYWNTETTAKTYYNGESYNDGDGSNYAGLTSAQMKQSSNLGYLSLASYWKTNDGVSYPGLNTVSNNAPNAIIDDIFLTNRFVVPLDTILLNDGDVETGTSGLIISVLNHTNSAITIDEANNTIIFPAEGGLGMGDTLYYRAGEVIGNDTIYGNTICARFILSLEGDGTETNPFLIHNYKELKAIPTMGVDKYYKLANDIDAYSSQTDNLSGGVYLGFDPISGFAGTFDGNGYVIRNLYINHTSERSGLFGRIEASATIENVGLVNVSVNGGAVVGALVGSDGGGTITNCYSTGTVSGNSYIGGLIGLVAYNSVYKCYSTCDVSGISYLGGLIGFAGANSITEKSNITDCYATGAITASGSYAGGLIADVSAGTFSNCYATGAVSGSDYVGGLIGEQKYISSYGISTIEECYAIGKITSSGSNVGGLVGSLQNYLNNSYWDTESTGVSVGYVASGSFASALNVTGEITADMKSSALYNLYTYYSFNSNIDKTPPALKDMDNAPFAYGESITIEAGDTIDFSALLANDYDYETAQANLTLTVQSLSEGTIGSSYIIAPSAFATTDTIKVQYRVGETRSNGDVLWGNVAVAKLSRIVSSNAFLSDLTIDGTTVAGFDSLTYSYTVELPKGTTATPTIAGTLYDVNASQVVAQADFSVSDSTATIVVTAENGTTTHTYSVKFYVSTKELPEVVWDAPANIVYGTALSSTQLNASSTVAGSFVYTPAIDSLLNAGDAQTLSVTFTPDDLNAYIPTTKTVVINVEKATLTVTANNQTKVYGSANPELTFAYSGWVNGVETIDVTPTISTTINATTNVGVYADSIIMTSGSDNNYVFSFVAGDFEVTKATLTATANDQTKVYSSVNPELTFAYTGWVNGVETIDVAPAINTSVSTTTGAGIYTDAITLTGGSDNNYNLDLVAGNFEVTKATLTVTADNQTKVYGTANPELTFTYSGWANGVEPIDVAPAIATTVDATTNAGTYVDAITLTGGSDNNYTFNYVAGDFEVTKATLTVTVDNQTKVYGSANPELTFAYSGWVNGVETIDGTPTITTTINATTNVGTYTDAITLTNGSDNNYDFDFIAGDFEVTKATLTAKADNKTIYLGQAIPELTVSYVGFVNGDDASVLGSEPSLNTTAVASGPSGSYSISISGGSDNNYSLEYVAGTLVISDKDVPVITWTTPSDVVYGTALSTTQLNATSPVSGTFTYNPAVGTVLNAGSLQTLHVHFVPDNTTQYAENDFNVKINILKAGLNITANDTSKVYGESTPVLTVLYEGFVNGDDANDLSVKPVASVAAGDGINVGNYTITASGGVSSNYMFNYFTGNLEVAKALLTVTADDKVVCLNQAIPQLTISYSGFVNGDDETVLDIKPTAATTALLGSPAGSYPITVSGGSDDNYDFDYVAGTLKVSVVQVPVIVWPAPADIVYGTLLSAKQLNAVAKVGTDTISGTFTYNPSLGTRLAVGNSQPITVHFTPDNTTFYESASGNVSINVTKATLTVTANSQTKMYGSSNPELTYRCSGWVNGVETIDVEPTISTTITETTRVGTYSGSITLSGGSDNNYKLNLVPGDFSVTKATLTVAVDNQYKVYGEENPELTYTYRGWVNGIETVDKAPTLTTTVTRTTGSGSYLGAITASGASDDAYNFVYVPGYFAIDKAALTVTADDQTKVYGSANPELTVTYRGWVNGVEAIDEAPTISTNVNAATDAGNYPDSIIVTGGSDNNYTFNYVAGDFEVTKALLTVKANDLISYYGEIINPTATITGFANGDDEAVIDVMPVASISGTAPRSMGNYTISCNGASDNNYDFRYADGTLTVNKAVLTAVADSQRISYGEIIPALTIRYEGFQYGDDKSILTTLPVASVESSAGENAGSYPITVSGGTAANYNFQYKSGVLTVDKALLTVTADSQAIVYGDTIPALTIRYEGFVNREDSTALELLPVAYLDTVGGSEITETLGAGIYPIVVSGGKATNYDFKYVGDTLTVTKALLTVKPNRQVITYGDKIPAFMIGYDGFVAGDTIADLDTLPVAAVDGIDWLDAGVYPVQVSGGWSKNYRFEYVNDTLVVEKSLLTVTADNKESLLKNIPELTFTYSGFVNGDSEASLDEVPVVSTSATTTSPAGIYSIEVSGGSDNNYEFTYVAGTLTIINKQIPVITWNTPAPIVYGSTLNETQLNATTDVPGTFVYSPAEGGILNAGNEQPLVVTFIPDNTSNYVEVSDTVLIHVEKAVLTVTAVDQVINKGMEPSDFTLIYSGFVNGENLDVIDEVPVASTSANSESNSGTYAITVSGGLDNNYSFNYVNGTLTILSNVGIDVAKTIRVSVYPNPFTDRITVTTSSNVDGSYELTDNTGKVVGKGAIENGRSNLLLSTLRKGVYLLQVNFEEGKQVFRIVKSE